MTRLTVIPVPGDSAEDVVVADHGPYEGSVFTGTEDGSIWRVSPDGAKVDLVANTGGHPLGIEIAADGRLLVCDCTLGLLSVDPASGSVERLLSEVDGVPMRFCNNAAIAGDGTIYFSDSSLHHDQPHWKDEFLRLTRTGRLLRLDPDGTLTTLLDDLSFANGVALPADESFVAVAETAARNVARLWLTGDRAGTRDALCTDLPGYPDNIARGSDGLIWVTIASPRDALVERVQRGPMALRNAVTKVPEALQPKPKQTVRVQAYDDQGRLVHDVDVPAAERGAPYHMVTGVREHDGRVWMGSLHEPAIAYLDL